MSKATCICGEFKNLTSVCRRCETKIYCSKECKRIDWKYHREECKKECHLCSEMYSCKEKKILYCKHSFHKSCIDKWLKTNDTCPLCREKHIERKQINECNEINEEDSNAEVRRELALLITYAIGICILKGDCPKVLYDFREYLMERQRNQWN